MKVSLGRKLYFLLFFGAIGACGLMLFYGDRGLLHLADLESEYQALQQSNADLREQNRRLMLRIDKIKTDPLYIEDEARMKMGLIRPDEVIYQFAEEITPAATN